MPKSSRAEVAEWMRLQAGWCLDLGSPLYAELLNRAAADAEAGGPVWDVVVGSEFDPGPSALALRLMGQVHRLVLDGRAPALAAHYPSAGGDGDAAKAWPAFRQLLVDRGQELQTAIARPVQTNEVGRCAALVGGFLTVAARTGLPLRLCEVGTSAGLNLRFDQYRYESDGRGWGPSPSPVRLRYCPPVSEEVPSVVVVERRGCDMEPVDPTSGDGRLTLLSFVWPDQLERIGVLEGALAVAPRVPASVDRADAVAWLEAQLSRSPADVATVVFHSVFIEYLSPTAQARISAVLAEAGRRATARSPLAHLRMEPEQRRMGVRLTLWPDGQEKLIATAGAHGHPVRWRGWS